jgi:predicted MPP superfamily phosphohydrolase
MTDAAVDLLVAAMAIASIVPLWMATAKRAPWVPGAVWLLANLMVSEVAALTLTADDGHPIAFAAMRVWCWMFFAWLPLALLTVAVRRRAHRGEAGVLVALAVVGLAVGADAFLIEPHHLEVSHHEVAVEGLDAPFRIGVVADFQTDHLGAHERAALAAIADAAPDLVLWPGDVIVGPNGPSRDRNLAGLRALIAEVELRPPLGMLVVQGNIDDPLHWREQLAGVGLIPWTDTRRVGPITLTGMDLETSFDATLVIPPVDGPHVAFGHAPDFSLGTIAADLLLAGHTHGGQVQLPWIGPLITLSQVPRAWADGRTELSGGRTLIVSRGVGMERGHAPRLRFMCRPEVLVVDLVPQ